MKEKVKAPLGKIIRTRPDPNYRKHYVCYGKWGWAGPLVMPPECTMSDERVENEAGQPTYRLRLVH